MEKIIKDLQDCSSSPDLNEIKRCLNLLAVKARELPDEQMKNYNVDPIIKTILRNHPCVEILDKISEILILSHSPVLFMDELNYFTAQPHLAVPTLMLIFEIKNRFDLEFPQFYEKLEETICRDNAISEGYLIFLLKTLQNRKLHTDEIAPIVKRLVQISTDTLSNECIKILYSVIVILRMHPGCFKIVHKLKKLYIFLESFDSIASIARRIFIEAENPELRPSMVFLENFSFPDLGK